MSDDTGYSGQYFEGSGDYFRAWSVSFLSCQCWGRNNNGQLGQGDTLDRGDDPAHMGANLNSIDFGAGGSPIELDCGKFHTCALLDDDSIKVKARDHIISVVFMGIPKGGCCCCPQ